MFNFVIVDADGRQVFTFRAGELFNVKIEEGYTLSLSIHTAGTSQSGEKPKAVNLKFGQIEAEGQD